MTIEATVRSLAATDEPGQLGANGWAALVDDLNLVIDRAKSEHPGLPVVWSPTAWVRLRRNSF